MLKIKNLHASTEDKEILKGVDLEENAGEVHSIKGTNGSGKSTLAMVLAGREDYEVTEGSIEFNREDLVDLAPEERAREGVFLAFQYPVEIPGVSNINFLRAAINEKRTHHGLEPLSGKDFLSLVKEKSALVELDDKLKNRSVNEGFQAVRKNEMRSSKWRCLNQSWLYGRNRFRLDIDALKIVSHGVNSLKSKENATIIVTHYQRLLDYIVPDFVHVLYDGKIVKSGSKELALELEEKGYDWIKEKPTV